MPQMAPISWLILFILFSLTFIIFNMMNYFSFFYLKSNSFSNPQYSKKNSSLNWKW